MKIGNYQIISELGSGGMATVYLARHEGLDITVAIKVLNKDLVHIENIRKRFLAEARYLARLKHANIVMVTDLIEENGMAAYAMKYIQGETLSEILRKNSKPPYEQIIDIFSQILNAVGYVHTENLIHRDIKPANIMITTEGKVKLMDFGIAKNTDPSSAEYTITHQDSKMGTVMYMSPEQVKSTKEVTYSTDIYSLGVVLWQMVTGVKPYDLNEISRPEIEVSVLREKLPETNVAFWDAVIQKATEKNPENRYKDCSEFLLEINRYSEKTATKSEKINKKNNQEKTKIEISPSIADQPKAPLKKKPIQKNEKKKAEISKNTKIKNIFLKIIQKYINIDKPKYKLKIYTYQQLNTTNFLNRIQKYYYINVDTVLLFYDDTVFGKADDGLAIVLTKDSQLLLLIAEYYGEQKVYCLNKDHILHQRMLDISISGLWSQKLKIILNKNGNMYEEKFNMQIKNEFKDFEKFIRELIEETRLIIY